ADAEPSAGPVIDRTRFFRSDAGAPLLPSDPAPRLAVGTACRPLGHPTAPARRATRRTCAGGERDGSGTLPDERGRLGRTEPASRSGAARERLVTRRRVPDENRRNHRIALEVVELDPVVEIHVRVVCP